MVTMLVAGQINPILDTRLYDVDFLDSKVTPLTANAIAQAMYAQCNKDQNEYLIFECFVYVQKGSYCYKPRQVEGCP